MTIPLKLALPLLSVVESLPTWLYVRLPLWVEHPLLVSKHAAEDRRAAAAYKASCERARLAWIAQREANGPGCPWCPNREVTVWDDAAGDRYQGCTECGADWPIGPSPDDDNPYDDLRPLIQEKTR